MGLYDINASSARSTDQSLGVNADTVFNFAPYDSATVPGSNTLTETNPTSATTGSGSAGDGIPPNGVLIQSAAPVTINYIELGLIILVAFLILHHKK